MTAWGLYVEGSVSRRDGMRVTTVVRRRWHPTRRWWWSVDWRTGYAWHSTFGYERSLAAARRQVESCVGGQP